MNPEIKAYYEKLGTITHETKDFAGQGCSDYYLTIPNALGDREHLIAVMHPNNRYLEYASTLPVYFLYLLTGTEQQYTEQEALRLIKLKVFL